LNAVTQEFSLLINNLVAGANFEVAKTSLVQIATSLSLNSQLVSSFADSIKNIRDKFLSNPTSEEFLEELNTLKSSYITFIFGQTEFSTLFFEVIGDPSNQELLQMLAKLEQKIQSMTASETITFFTSKEGADEIAKVIVVLKQAYERFMQEGKF
jgi:predicted nucleic acid-binding protein